MYNYLIKLIKLFLLLGAGCIGLAHADVTIYAAASLKNALDEVEAQYRKRSGEKTVVSYASSSALARQIEGGAPADIFVSADLDWMDYVEKRKLVRAGTRTNLLRNEIVLIAPHPSMWTTQVGTLNSTPTRRSCGWSAENGVTITTTRLCPRCRLSLTGEADRSRAIM